MTTQTKSTTEAEATANRIRDLNEQVLEVGRNAGVSFLDVYEKSVKTFADYQDQVGDSSRVELGSPPSLTPRPSSRARSLRPMRQARATSSSSNGRSTS